MFKYNFGVCFDLVHANVFSHNTILEWINYFIKKDINKKFNNFHIHLSSNDNILDQHSYFKTKKEILKYQKLLIKFKCDKTLEFQVNEKCFDKNIFNFLMFNNLLKNKKIIN